MCSPTRACLLTGRNHHTCAMGGITDLAMGFPGYNGRIPKSCGFVPEVLRRAGWATFAVGKWHLAPADETHAAASRDRWPLGQGFERFYGFIGAETNQLGARPRRRQPTDPLHAAGPGYHLTEDLVDRAIGLSRRRPRRRSRQAVLPLSGARRVPRAAPGAARVDRAVPRAFDDGWDAWRAADPRAPARDRGSCPPGTALTPRPSWVQDWQRSLDADERRLRPDDGGVRGLPVAHRPQLGRLLDFLDATGELDDTLVIAALRQRRQRRGRPARHVQRELHLQRHRRTTPRRRWRSSTSSAGLRTYGHYPWGWALAGNTPFRRWKRETHEGGIGDPLIVPLAARSPTRARCGRSTSHAIDVAATILDVVRCRDARGARRRGAGPRRRHELRGIAARRRGPRAPRDPVLRAVRVPRDLRPRLEGGDLPLDGHRSLRRGRRTRSPRSPRTAGSSTTSPRTRRSPTTWRRRIPRSSASCRTSGGARPSATARCRSTRRRVFAPGRPPIGPPAATASSLVPGAAAVPEEVAPDTKLRPHSIVAWFDVPAGGAEGVLVAQGGRFGGYSLFVQDGRVRYTYELRGRGGRDHRVRGGAPARCARGRGRADTAPGPRHAGRAVVDGSRRRAARSLGRRRSASRSPARGSAAATTTGRRSPSATSRRSSSRG